MTTLASYGSARPARTGTAAPYQRRPVAVRPFTALVVEADPGTRTALADRLRSTGALEVAEAGSAAEARALVRRQSGDLCLVDLGLAEGNPLVLLGELRAAGWRRLVLLSANPEPVAVRAAFAAGAQGLLVTSSPAPALDLGVRQVVAGGVATAATGVVTAVRVRGVGDLSGREVEVLSLVAEGQSNKEVGDRLGLSALTVKSHLARISRKLGTGDRAEMVALAMRAGVIR